MYLKRLEIQGFKTFANRTVVEFPLGITAIVGPNGSGKCVTGETLITLSDGREIPIRDLVEAALANSRPTELDDGVMTSLNPQGVEIISLNPQTLRLEARPVAAFVKREAPPTLLRLRTRSGREITVTPTHPFFTLHEGQLCAQRSETLNAGDRIAVPQSIPAHNFSLNEKSDIYWDEIAAIEEQLAADPWVYDLCVEETHNFIANNIVAHNSNVTDAIRWVLGEQSFSALRCRRTEDLIYSGGGKRAAQGMAEVALTIDNTDRTLPLDFNEVTITRRSYRSGENEYYINKSRVRLRDIQEATAPLASSYTLINQGLVDAALTLRPEERRGLFEDAASISLSVTKRAEAERRLKQTEENLGRILDLQADVEPRLRALKRQAREAEQVQEIEAALREALIVHYRRQWRAARQALAEAEAAVEASADAVARTRAEHEGAGESLEAARAERDAARAELETFAEAVAAAERALEQDEREWAVLHERCEALDSRVAEAAERVAGLESDLAAAVARRAALAEQLVAARAERDAARARLQGVEAAEQTALEARRSTERALETARERSFAAASALTDARNRARQLAERVAALAREQTDMATDQSEAEARLAAAEAALAAAHEGRDAAEAAFGETQQAEEAAQKAVVAARAARREAEEAVAAARREADTLGSRLEALRRTAAAGAGVFAGVKAALQWAEREKRDFALVSTIIEVPAELETALEVALGARLQNIVVPRWEDGEAAINELKRIDAGRATFLPLDTLKTGRPGQAPKGAGILGVASDLVDYAERYERVVIHLLGRTLIVEDLATARRVLRDLEGGWSIVTRGGEQVSTAGAMTGGARTRETGTLRRERELRELPVQLDQAQRGLREREQSLQAAVGAIAAAEQAAREAEQARRAARQAGEQARDLVANRARVRERAAQELTWHRSRGDAVAREQAGLAEQQAAAAAAMADLEAAAAAAETALLAARDEAAAAIEAGRASDERLAEGRSAIASSEATLKAAIEAERAQGAAVERLQANERDARARSAALAAQRDEARGQLAALAGTRAAHQAAVAEARAARAPLQERLQVAQTAAHSGESGERERAERLLAAQTAAGRAETALAQAQARRDQIWERCAEENIDIEAIGAGEAPADSAVGPAELAQQIEQGRARLRRMGTINPLAPQEYAELQERHGFLTAQVDDVRQAADGLRALIAELEEAMNSRFAQTFAAVAEAFSIAFTRLFGGGTAQLVLNDPDNPEGGIEIIAQPPGKRRQALSLLSGGERSLTAVALLVALLRVNPTPFCVMDEVDAALDEANVVRLRELLLEMSEQTQFVLVTHNRGTVEAAATLYGVTMNVDGASKLLSLRLDELVEDDGGGVAIGL